jgi:hypothetical protein
MVRSLRAQARHGHAAAVRRHLRRRLVGQVTVGGITWGSLCSAHIGYWVDRGWPGGRHADRGGAGRRPLLRRVGLHRVEVNIRPENTASLRVVEKLGFREEGTRRRSCTSPGLARPPVVRADRDEVPEGCCPLASQPPVLRRCACHASHIESHQSQLLILRHTGHGRVTRAPGGPTVLRVGQRIIYAALIVHVGCYFIPRWLAVTRSSPSRARWRSSTTRCGSCPAEPTRTSATS